MRRLPALIALAAAVPVLFGCATNPAEVDEHPEARVSVPDDGQALSPGTPVAYTSLTPGMCSNYRGDPRLGDMIGVVDCAEPHRFEIVAPITLPDAADAAYPGMDVIRPRVLDACGPHLRPFVGDRPGAQVTFVLGPMGEEAWNSGNRVYYCGVGAVSPTAGRATPVPQGNA